MRAQSPTPSQMRWLAAIASFMDKQPFAPTIRELCEMLDISSTNSASEMLWRLERSQLIERGRYKHTGRARMGAIRITERGMRWLHVMAEEQP